MANPHRILVVAITLLTCATASAAPPVDALGDPLPPFALARSGSTRWRHGGLIDAIAVSPDGTLIASHGIGDAVCVWNAKTGKLVRQFPPGAWGSHALAFSPDSKQLALATKNVFVDPVDRRNDGSGEFVCWDVTTGGERERRAEKLNGLQAGGRSRNAMAWTAAGRLVVAEMTGGSVTVYDPLDRTAGRSLHVLKQPSGGLVVFPNGGRVCAVGDDGQVSMWDSESGNF